MPVGRVHFGLCDRQDRTDDFLVIPPVQKSLLPYKCRGRNVALRLLGGMHVSSNDKLMVPVYRNSLVPGMQTVTVACAPGTCGKKCRQNGIYVQCQHTAPVVDRNGTSIVKEITVSGAVPIKLHSNHFRHTRL